MFDIGIWLEIVEHINDEFKVENIGLCHDVCLISVVGNESIELRPISTDDTIIEDRIFEFGVGKLTHEFNVEFKLFTLNTVENGISNDEYRGGGGG